MGRPENEDEQQALLDLTLPINYAHMSDNSLMLHWIHVKRAEANGNLNCI